MQVQVQVQVQMPVLATCTDIVDVSGLGPGMLLLYSGPRGIPETLVFRSKYRFRRRCRCVVCSFCTVCHNHFLMAVVLLKCIPVADVGVSPVRPCRPLLHHGDEAGVNAGEVSNTRAHSLYCVCGCI